MASSIRMDDELKARASAVAERAGKSPHALLLEAIAEKVEREEAKGYMAARAAKREARKPTPRKPSR